VGASAAVEAVQLRDHRGLLDGQGPEPGPNAEQRSRRGRRRHRCCVRGRHSRAVPAALGALLGKQARLVGDVEVVALLGKVGGPGREAGVEDAPVASGQGPGRDVTARTAPGAAAAAPVLGLSGEGARE
jgi:hypothetical protein